VNKESLLVAETVGTSGPRVDGCLDERFALSVRRRSNLLIAGAGKAACLLTKGLGAGEKPSVSLRAVDFEIATPPNSRTNANVMIRNR
jgi:hypothetical protein